MNRKVHASGGRRKKALRLRGAGVLSLAILVLGLSACATTGTNESDIATRAQLRWDSFFAGDLNATYQFLSPGYRSSVPSLQYQRKLLSQKVSWTDAEYIDSKCSEDSCKVRILLKYTLIGVLPGVPRFDSQSVIEENWIKSDGAWWFVPKD